MRAAVRSGSARARGPREIAVVGCGFRGVGCVSSSPRVLQTSPETRRDAPQAPPMSQTEGGFRKGGPAPPCIRPVLPRRAGGVGWMNGGLRYGPVPGAKPAFEDLYRDYLDRIYAFLRSQLGSAADAEDLTSQVFMKAYQAYARYEPRHETPAAWLFQIARNAALDHHRRAGRRERAERALAREPVSSADPGTLA